MQIGSRVNGPTSAPIVRPIFRGLHTMDQHNNQHCHAGRGTTCTWHSVVCMAASAAAVWPEPSRPHHEEFFGSKAELTDILKRMVVFIIPLVRQAARSCNMLIHVKCASLHASSTTDRACAIRAPASLVHFIVHRAVQYSY